MNKLLISHSSSIVNSNLPNSAGNFLSFLELSLFYNEIEHFFRLFQSSEPAGTWSGLDFRTVWVNDKDIHITQAPILFQKLIKSVQNVPSLLGRIKICFLFCFLFFQ